MCNCCFATRKSTIIFMIVISAISFIYGIANISKFASDTNIYRDLKTIFDNFDNLRVTDYPYSYDITQSLKSIEKGLGVILFIFTIIFLGVEILLLYFNCGDKEFKPLSAEVFNILNCTLIICIVLSGIFIALSIVYGALLHRANFEYSDFIYFMEKTLGLEIISNDEYRTCLLIGTLYGYFQIIHFIVLLTGFSKVKTKYKKMGSELSPDQNVNIDTNVNRIAYQPNPDQSPPAVEIHINNNGNNPPETRENMETQQVEIENPGTNKNK